MSEPTIIVLDDAESLYVHAAEEIVHFAGEEICMHGEFLLALSGGSTPAAIYELFGSRFKLSVDWKEVQFWWGDERCVPPDDQLSNYAMANRTLLSKLDLKPSQVHRIKGELAPEAAARDLEDQLTQAFHLATGELPRLDLVMLGLGGNRHTLSLFPGDGAAINERRRLALAVSVDAEPRNRVTLTAPVANNAHRLMFVVSGAGKADAVRDVIEGPRDSIRFPAQAIAPTDGELIWMLDKAAASKLSRP
ncbi:MAG TPA: 6-phosphogluconolactonase [Candidatus Binataceae bacterium]|nr:6-phosphogluconolactonase [Candidatus Binataceae bacterium]